jgi:hypothetical protein
MTDQEIQLEFNISEKALSEIRSWNQIDEKITNFCNTSSLKTFEKLFGESEGNRLMNHFVKDCQRKDFKKFRTYLISEQWNYLITYIYKTQI